MRKEILGKKLKKARNPKGHPYRPIARDDARGDTEKVMKQSGALLRKDSQPVRYLVVADSVFARKNLIEMIEMFGGELAGEAAVGLTAIAGYYRLRPDIVRVDISMPQVAVVEAR